MYFPFEELSDESRVWVYTGTRAFTSTEEISATQLLREFCERWAAHGHPLKTSFKIDRNQFIIMAVEEDYHAPSGCSIDSSVAVLRQIHSTTGIDFLNRAYTPFEVDGNTVLVPLGELKSAFAAQRLLPQTVAFNTLVASKREFKKRWLISAENTWMAKYLAKPALTS